MVEVSRDSTERRRLKQIEMFRLGIVGNTPEKPPSSRYLDWFHGQASTRGPNDIHHRLGSNAWDAAPGDHTHSVDEFLDVEQDVSYDVTGGALTTQPTFSGDASEAFEAFYSRFGDIVVFTYKVNFDTITNFGTGQYYMSLPYPAKHPFICAGGALHDESTAKIYSIFGVADDDLGSLDTIRLWYTQSNGQMAEFEEGSPLNLDTADHLFISGTYLAETF